MTGRFGVEIHSWPGKPVFGARVKWGGNKHEGLVTDVGLGTWRVTVAITAGGITRELQTDWRHLEIVAMPKGWKPRKNKNHG